MKIYCLGESIKKIEGSNKGRNNLIKSNIFKALFNVFFTKGSIIYNENENTILNICEKILKIPYLYCLLYTSPSPRD